MPMLRLSLTTPVLLLAAALIAGCSRSGAELGEMRPELGDFRLCYNIVTTNDVVKGPLSREADMEVFADLIRDQVDRRFARYEGQRLYHIAIHTDAYVLAVPGVPLVASPRSALIISVNLWDDALGGPVNAEPHQITVLESAGAGSIVGSGLTMTVDEQMQMLAQNAALAIENWMIANPGWFVRSGDIPETRETTGPTATAPTAAPAPETPVEAAAPEAAATAAAPATGCGRR